VVSGHGIASHQPTAYTVFADGVAYDPATNRWRSLPAMPTSRLGHTAVWTGQRLLVWGGLTGRAGASVAPPHGVAYDPAANRWTALPQSPLPGRIGHLAVWTGTQMLIWGGTSVRPNPSTDNFTALADGAVYTPTCCSVPGSSMARGQAPRAIHASPGNTNGKLGPPASRRAVVPAAADRSV
jgi:hypothetical protein